MSRFIDAVRITAPETAVWRACQGCGLLAPLPPEVEVCRACQPADDSDRDEPREGIR